MRWISIGDRTPPGTSARATPLDACVARPRAAARSSRTLTVQTVGYSVEPEYRYPREGREPQVSGYIATNVVHITTPDLARVGRVVDAAVGTGAHRVQRIRFTLKKRDTVYADALRQAASRAKAEADILASALGLRVVRVLSAVEESGFARPFVDAARPAALAVASTPVEPGTVDVEARVLLTVEVSGGFAASR